MSLLIALFVVSLESYQFFLVQCMLMKTFKPCFFYSLAKHVILGETVLIYHLIVAKPVKHAEIRLLLILNLAMHWIGLLILSINL